MPIFIDVLRLGAIRPAHSGSSATGCYTKRRREARHHDFRIAAESKSTIIESADLNPRGACVSTPLDEPWTTSSSKETIGNGPKFTAPRKSASALAAVPDDPSCIERRSAQGFPLARISERGFLSNRKRSNTVPPPTATGRPPLFARRLQCRQRQGKCRASSDCLSPSR